MTTLRAATWAASLLAALPHLAAQRAAHLPEALNSEYEERQPLPSADGTRLYFWRRNMPGNTGGMADPGDAWLSDRPAPADAAAAWAKAKRMGLPVNSPGHDFVWQARPDTLYVYHADAAQAGEPTLGYYTRLPEGQWGRFRRLRIQDYTPKGTYTDYHLAPNGCLFLTNQALNGLGGTDLYIAFPLNDSTWAQPANLGRSINSPGNEDAPRISPDGQYLFFSSDGWNEGGHHDIFYSFRLDDTYLRWSMPLPLGPPVNSPGYDFDPAFDPQGHYLYWCSDQETYGLTDIFRMRIDSCGTDIHPLADLTLCTGQQATLSAGFALGQPAWQWFRDGTPIAGATGRQLVTSEPGSYQVKMQRQDGCRDTSAARRVRFLPAPEARVQAQSPYLCADQPARLTAQVRSEAPVSYQWFFRDIPIPDATQPSVEATMPGPFSVAVANGQCGTRSDSVWVSRLKAPEIHLYLDSAQALGPMPTGERAWRLRAFARLPAGQVAVNSMALSPDLMAVLAGTRAVGRGKARQYEEYFEGFSLGGARLFSVGGLRSPTPPTRRYLAVDPEGYTVVGTPELFLRRMGPDGKRSWEIPQPMPGLRGVATDAIGDVFAFGHFKENLTLENQTFTSAPYGSYFVAKYTRWRRLEWVRTFAADPFRHDFGNAIQTDCRGNVYVAGCFESFANFPGTVLRMDWDMRNYFVAKYDNQGAFCWARRIATLPVQAPTASLSVDCQGNAYFLANHRIVKFAPTGQLRYVREVQLPAPPRTLRMAANAAGEVFLFGFAADAEEQFLVRIDDAGEFQALWHDALPAPAATHLPAIAATDEAVWLIATPDPAHAPDSIRHPLLLAMHGPQTPGIHAPVAHPSLPLCAGDTLRLHATAQPGTALQWLRDGQPLASHTDTIRIHAPGQYDVRASAPGCTLVSAPQPVVANCGEPALPGELIAAPDGQPRRLQGREVRAQDTMMVHTGALTVEIWDHAAADGDTVSVLANGQWITRAYGLRKQPQAFKVHMEPGAAGHIILYAHNLGSIPPNTMALRIGDGTRQKEFLLRSDQKICGSIRLLPR